MAKRHINLLVILQVHLVVGGSVYHAAHFVSRTVVMVLEGWLLGGRSLLYSFM